VISVEVDSDLEHTDDSVQEDLVAWLEERVRVLFERIGRAADADVSVLLTTCETIQQLNRDYRDVDEPTDVLSFGLWDVPDEAGETRSAGDIVIALPVARALVASRTHRDRVLSEEGVDTTWTLHDELLFLCVHATLHLIGYDHADEEGELEMRAQERVLFAAIRHGDAA